MPTTRREITLGSSCDHFPEGTHMCLIYDDDEQRKTVLARFLADGVTEGEQVGYFTDKTDADEVRDWVAECGVDLDDTDRDDRFGVYTAEDVYCPGGRFVPTGMLERLGGAYDKAVSAGFVGARVSGEMSWALKGVPGSECLVEYEARINNISETQPVTPICQYDARQFDGATLLNVLKVHPMMIVHGQIVRNPYYMKPQEFLEEFRPTASAYG